MIRSAEGWRRRGDPRLHVDCFRSLGPPSCLSGTCHQPLAQLKVQPARDPAANAVLPPLKLSAPHL